MSSRVRFEPAPTIRLKPLDPAAPPHETPTVALRTAEVDALLRYAGETGDEVAPTEACPTVELIPLARPAPPAPVKIARGSEAVTSVFRARRERTQLRISDLKIEELEVAPEGDDGAAGSPGPRRPRR